MKKSFKILKESLNKELLVQLKEKVSLVEQIRKLETERKLILLTIINDLIPNMEEKTIKNVSSKFPGFYIETTKYCFGILKRFNLNKSLNTFRTELFDYLDNSEFIKLLHKDEIKSIDAKIKVLQEKLEKETDLKIGIISKRIEIVKNLEGVDLSKINPQIYEVVKLAIEMQNDIIQKYGINYFNKDLYFKNKNTESHDVIDPNLLEMWLWDQLSLPNSEFMIEISKLNEVNYDPSLGFSLDDLDNFFWNI